MKNTTGARAASIYAAVSARSRKRIFISDAHERASVELPIGKYKINIKDSIPGDAAHFKGGFSYELMVKRTALASAASAVASASAAPSASASVAAASAKPGVKAAAAAVKPGAAVAKPAGSPSAVASARRCAEEVDRHARRHRPALGVQPVHFEQGETVAMDHCFTS